MLEANAYVSGTKEEFFNAKVRAHPKDSSYLAKWRDGKQ